MCTIKINIEGYMIWCELQCSMVLNYSWWKINNDSILAVAIIVSYLDNSITIEELLMVIHVTFDEFHKKIILYIFIIVTNCSF